MKVRFNCQSIFLCVFNQYLRLIIARVSGGEISIIDEKGFSSSAGYCALPPSPFFMELFIATVSVTMSDGRNSAGAQEGRCPGPGTQCVGAAAPQVTVCLAVDYSGVTHCELHSLPSHCVKNEPPKNRSNRSER